MQSLSLSLSWLIVCDIVVHMVTVNHNVNDCAHVLVVSFHIALEQFINCYKLFVSSFLVVFIYLFIFPFEDCCLIMQLVSVNLFKVTIDPPESCNSVL